MHARICGAHGRRRDRPCQQVAGARTAHPGVGRCWLHGGVQRGKDRRLKHGLHSKTMLATLKQRLAEWDAHDKPRAAELLGELETLRALARHYLDQPEKGFDAELLLKIVGRITRVVAVQQRVDERGTISLPAVQEFFERVGRVIARHVADQDVLQRIDRDVLQIPLLTTVGENVVHVDEG
jgi:hypothetical protein